MEDAAVGYAEKRPGYYLGRYRVGDKMMTVKDEHGATIRFATKRAAKAAANSEHAKVQLGTWRDPTGGQTLFGDWVNIWYERQDLAQSTMQNYKHHIEEHLLPTFEEIPLAQIFGADVDEWERKERAAGYSVSSVRTWRTTLSTVLADAVAEGLIAANPAVKRRGRGKRAGRSRRRGPEKVTTNALGALLIAERAAILTGRDAEFVMIMVKYWTGLRWGEVVGLETEFVRPERIRVEWQLWEDDAGAHHRLPPKDDSYRDVDIPDWLARMIKRHLAEARPAACQCHGLRHVFSGQKSPHARRSAFSDWIFDPAATGWFPSRGRRLPKRPVSIDADPWPGRVLRGRGNADRATACWIPIAPGLTPHSLRHCHKTLMAELRTPEIFSHERLGHMLSGIGGIYAHVTPAMRQELLDGLTERWIDALDARLGMNLRSPVAILDDLLRERHENGGERSEESDVVRMPTSSRSRLTARRPQPTRAG